MDRPRRPHLVALGIYALVTVVFALTSSPERLTSHTPFNHFALLADAWRHHRLDLGGPPPPYTGNNDFAVFQGKTYVSFPPFPAVLIAPLVALSGGADQTRDGLFFLLFAGVGPAVLYLALEKLSLSGQSGRTWRENVALALLFAFGTVYWFSSVQGTVWFAAHTIGVGLAALYIYASIGAEHPLLAGLALALGFATRTPLGFAFPLFLLEAYRAASRIPAAALPGAGGAPRLGRADARALFETLARFGAPVAVILGLLLWHNHARFGDAFEFGHRLLAIGWKARIDKWGLFSYHYLGRNLAVILTSLPYTGVQGVPFQINAHGLALWLTSPFLGFALCRAPRGSGRGLFFALAVTAALVALPSLSYQNSGWIQFGYRFSNDFALFLMVMIALGRRRLGRVFWALGAAAVVVNGFGALSFQRSGFDRFYFIDGSQRILHQPD